MVQEASTVMMLHLRYFSIFRYALVEEIVREGSPNDETADRRADKNRLASMAMAHHNVLVG